MTRQSTTVTMWTFEITGSQVYVTFLAMMLLKWIAHGWVRMLDARLDELRRPTSVQRNKCMFYVLEAIVTTVGWSCTSPTRRGAWCFDPDSGNPCRLCHLHRQVSRERSRTRYAPSAYPRISCV